MRTLFHITTQDLWEKAQEQRVYFADSLQKEGFIHFSRPHQALPSAELFFSQSQEKLVLLTVDQHKLSSHVKYEGEGQEKFPHLYGPLNLDAVISVDEFQRENGKYTLPSQFALKEKNLIRPAFLGDEAEISSVHVHAWQETYKGLIPEKTLADLPLSFHRRWMWWRQLLKKNVDQVFVVESENHGIVAFCSLTSARDADFKDYGEVSTIYALSAYQGKGLGSLLFKRALAKLKASKYQKAYLWVLKDNPTLDFYLKQGGKNTNKQKFVNIEGQSYADVALEWDLAQV